jgi:hypothetical protein
LRGIYNIVLQKSRGRKMKVKASKAPLKAFFKCCKKSIITPVFAMDGSGYSVLDPTFGGPDIFKLAEACWKKKINVVIAIVPFGGYEINCVINMDLLAEIACDGHSRLAGLMRAVIDTPKPEPVQPSKIIQLPGVMNTGSKLIVPQ